MFRIQGSIIVHRPVEEVFALLPYAATSNMQMSYPAWIRKAHERASERIAYNRSLPAGKIEIGSTFQTQIQGPRTQSITTFRVVELEPNKRLTLEQYSVGATSTSGITSYELAPVPEGTRLIITVEAQAQGCMGLLFKLFDSLPWIKPLSTSFSLRMLKRTLEQGILLQPGHRISGPLPALDESQLPEEAPE